MVIQSIIENLCITFEYQPILSTHNDGFLGLEGLMRVKDPDEAWSPDQAFRAAQAESCVLLFKSFHAY